MAATAFTSERDLRDALALQSEVARAIANEIRIQLTPQDKQRLTVARSIHPDAYEAYLKGRYYWNLRGTSEYLANAIAQFRRATEIEPSYALAWSALAETYGLQFAYAEAKTAAAKAIELDDTLAHAHASLAVALMNRDWDWPAAEREIRRAVELEPRSAEAHHQYSHYWLSMGKLAESLQESRLALELEPLSSIMVEHLAQHYYFAREWDKAIETVRGRDILGLGQVILGKCYEQKRMFREAVEECRKAPGMGPPALAHVYASAGERGEARKLLDGLEARPKPGSYSIALVYAGLGETEQAFAWLERAYRERSSFGLMTLKLEPHLDPLRGDPRFADLVRRVGLTP